jgi:hypothetical protein
MREAVRATVLGGAMVELAGHRPPARVIDAVLSSAGAPSVELPRLRPSRDGSALLRAVVAHHGDVELRLDAAFAPKDLGRAVACLQALEAAGIERAPRLVGEGTIAGVRWTAETVLPGKRPHRLTDRLLAQVTEFLLQLASDVPSDGTVVGDDLRHVGHLFPHAHASVARIADTIEPLAAELPKVVRHGDLLLANLLVLDGRLTGIVDWETWHAGGVPGADLLQLVASNGLRLHGEVGTLWRARPWNSPAFLRAATPYFESLDMRVDEDVLLTVAVAWWANRVRALMRRCERWHLAWEPTWVSSNIDEVVGSIFQELRLGRPRLE